MKSYRCLKVESSRCWSNLIGLILYQNTKIHSFDARFAKLDTQMPFHISRVGKETTLKYIKYIKSYSCFIGVNFNKAYIVKYSNLKINPKIHSFDDQIAKLAEQVPYHI